MSIYNWSRCTHEGIGQPGCPTCDPDRDRVMCRALWLDKQDLRSALEQALEALEMGANPLANGEERSRRACAAALAAAKKALGK